MKAGFFRIDITPPVRTPLMGWGVAKERLAVAVHDPLFVRALWIEQGAEVILILAFDLCFVAREDTERWRGMLARMLGLEPRQLLFTATHTHAGPAVGIYLDLMWEAPPRSYLAELDAAVLLASQEARRLAVEVTLSTTTTRSVLPVNRRKRTASGLVNAPNPDGPVFDRVPIVLIRTLEDEPVCLLFSMATHPVCFGRPEVSADYPGVAMNQLDKSLGKACSMFILGPAGDSRPRTLMKGHEWIGWPQGQEMVETGSILASEVALAMKTLKSTKPLLQARLIESYWPLSPLSVDELKGCLRSTRATKVAWAKQQLENRTRGPAALFVPILMHRIDLSEDLRIVGIEGEPVHAFGAITEKVYNGGTTFCAGYCHGEGMYLVTTAMLAEGGYEPESYWEYHQPGPLAPGTENVFCEALERLRRM